MFFKQFKGKKFPIWHQTTIVFLLRWKTNIMMLSASTFDIFDLTWRSKIWLQERNLWQGPHTGTESGCNFEKQTSNINNYGPLPKFLLKITCHFLLACKRKEKKMLSFYCQSWTVYLSIHKRRETNKSPTFFLLVLQAMILVTLI